VATGGHVKIGGQGTHRCFMGRCALYTVIHCVAGSPWRIFFFCRSSSSSSNTSRPRFCPTFTSA
jgi:hypothetical protein